MSNPNYNVIFNLQYYEIPGENTTIVLNDTLVDLPIYFEIAKLNLIQTSREQIIDRAGHQVGSDVEIQTQEDQVLFSTSQLEVGIYQLIAQINNFVGDVDHPNEYVWNLRITE